MDCKMPWALRLNAFMFCILLFAVATDTWAQVYRCEHDGKVSFSDQKCAVGAKTVQKDYASPAGSGVLDLQVVVTHYPIQGQDQASLMRSLNANGPKGFHGLASWDVRYEYTTRKNNEVCRIDTVRVNISGKILMPRWADESSAPAGLRQRWSDYYMALKRHEDGHIQHGRELALLVKEKLLGLGAVPCNQVQALAQGEFDRLYGNLKTRDQEYDARTNHGANQGVAF
jgi:predicted secreted Zn-dependent protease